MLHALLTGTRQNADGFFLTPFGETMPYIRAWPWLQARMLAIGARGMQFNLDAGEAITRFEIDWTDAKSLISYI